jgi:hypothetical protein
MATTAQPIINHARRLCAKATEGNKFITRKIIGAVIKDLREVRLSQSNAPLFGEIDQAIEDLAQFA